jgi:hypothetical protein
MMAIPQDLDAINSPAPFPGIIVDEPHHFIGRMALLFQKTEAEIAAVTRSPD